MKKILFQGDSITDAARSRVNVFDLGYGYVTQVTARLGFDHIGEFEFINRGVGGNKIRDILARNKEDVIAHKPDYISILCGVNDVWYYFDKPNGFDYEAYSADFTQMLDEIKEALPEVKIMILEPFLEEGTNTSEKDNPEKYRLFRKCTEDCADCTRKIAEKYGCYYLKLQKLFDDAVSKADKENYFLDGIHPTIVGHKIIADAWIEAFEKGL